MYLAAGVYLSEAPARPPPRYTLYEYIVHIHNGKGGRVGEPVRRLERDASSQEG